MVQLTKAIYGTCLHLVYFFQFLISGLQAEKKTAEIM